LVGPSVAANCEKNLATMEKMRKGRLREGAR
jgi:hypothetical protein